MEAMQTYEQGMQMVDLINCLRSHGINVLSCTLDQITVRSIFCKEGQAYTEDETIQASTSAVRAYLGY